MKKVLKYIIFALIAIILVGTFVFLFKNSRPQKELYQEHETRYGNISRTTVVTGKIEPRNEVNIKPQINGIISELRKEAGQMVKEGYITQAEMDEVKSQPLSLLPRPRITSHKEGAAPYFREHLRVIMMAKRPERSQYASWQGQQYHDDSVAWETDPLYGWCNKNTKKDGSHYDIYSDGLKIYTSIDTRMQKMAEEALFEHVAKYL